MRLTICTVPCVVIRVSGAGWSVSKGHSQVCVSIAKPSAMAAMPYKSLLEIWIYDIAVSQNSDTTRSFHLLEVSHSKQDSCPPRKQLTLGVIPRIPCLLAS